MRLVFAIFLPPPLSRLFFLYRCLHQAFENHRRFFRLFLWNLQDNFIMNAAYDLSTSAGRLKILRSVAECDVWIGK